MTATSDLIGPDLDAWVARAEGYTVFGTPEEYGYVCWRTPDNCVMGYSFEPSTNSAQGLPIIERQRISAISEAWDGTWTAGYDFRDGSFLGVSEGGPTMLIAAMRARVAHAFGDTVPSEDHR